MELQVTVDYTCTDGSLQAKHNYRLAGQELRRPVTGASGYIHAAKFAEFLGYILRRMGADRCDTRRADSSSQHSDHHLRLRVGHARQAQPVSDTLVYIIDYPHPVHKIGGKLGRVTSYRFR